MHTRHSSVDYKGVSMCQWILGLIKINNFNTRNPIFTVECNKFPWIITFYFLNTCSNEWIEELCSTRELFDWYGIRKKVDIFIIFILKKTTLSRMVHNIPMIAENAGLFLEEEVLGLKWSDGYWLFQYLGGSVGSSPWRAFHWFIFLLRLRGMKLGTRIIQSSSLCQIITQHS